MKTSVGAIKNPNRYRGMAQAEPQVGTAIRRIYDLFLSGPAIPISFRVIDRLGKFGRKWGGVRECLLGYGLDIRQYKHGYWWLVGREDGGWKICRFSTRHRLRLEERNSRSRWMGEVRMTQDMTEDEAARQFCPIMSRENLERCLTRRCMAWRWKEEIGKEWVSQGNDWVQPIELSTTHGHCGLVK